MSDLKSKNPNDYFPAKFEDLRPNTAVTFGICLYFPLNNHVMLWRKPGEQIDFDFLKRYSSLGLVDIWIHRDDAESYENYMNPKKDAAVTTEAYPEKAQAAEETAPPKKKTAEGAFISEVMEN